MSPNPRPLGIHAKSAAGAGGYRAAPAAPARPPAAPLDQGTRRRWALKRQAERLLADKEQRISRDGHAVAAFTYRVAMCHRGTDGGPVVLYRSADGRNARFAGVQTCGSVWHCPVCAPKIARTRRDEINRAIAAWLGPESWNGDRHVYLATYTTQHSAADAGAGELGSILPRVAKALSKLKGSRAFRALMERAKSAGAIRGLETTFGELNGWHVHTHELLFAGRAGVLQHDDRGRVQVWRSPVYRGMRRLWAETLLKHGLAGLRPGDIGAERFKRLRNLLRHCFTLQAGAYAAEYVATMGREPERERGSWGLGSELTKSHLKRGAELDGRPQRCAHASPWSLLNDALDGDARSGELYREFAIAFQGRRQLYWSKGLKAELGITELDDEEIARAPDADCTEKVMEIGPSSWSLVIAHEARFAVLKAAADDGRAGVERLIAELEERPPRYSGEFTVTGLPRSDLVPRWNGAIAA